MQAHAVTLSVSPDSLPSPAPAITDINQQLNNLKDRIASKVAQLKLVEKRGIIGTVTDVGETQLTLSDTNGNTRYVDIDEFTKFSSPSAKAGFGISDITKGTTVGALGIYNKESRRITGRFVDVLVLQKVISGAITNIDAKKFALTVTSPDQKDMHVDIETVTKTYAYNKDSGLVRSGFSKIQQGERVIVVGYIDINDKNTIIASRILRLPTLKVNPKIPIMKSDDLSGTPSSGSGIKKIIHE